MKRREVLQSLGVAAIGAALSPYLKAAYVSGDHIQVITLDPVQEHVRHGNLNLFLDNENKDMAIQRHRFFANGFNPSDNDPMLCTLNLRSSEGVIDCQIQVANGRITYSNVEAFLLNDQSFEQCAGDILIPTNSGFEHNGLHLQEDSGLFVQRDGWGELKGRALLIRTGKKA